jgi:hypothetical protein
MPPHLNPLPLSASEGEGGKHNPLCQVWVKISPQPRRGTLFISQNIQNFLSSNNSGSKFAARALADLREHAILKEKIVNESV